MTILGFDWGGTSVKYALWKNEALEQHGSFPTPTSWPQLKQQMIAVYQSFRATEISGVAISSPGVVNNEIGVIEGISAIPYIHHFPIKEELSQLFKVPVSLENDANAAGIAEVWRGAAQDYQDVLFLVLGTGVGGSIIRNGQVQKGAHLYSGEFGLMYVNDRQTFSQVGTAVKMAERYCLRKHVANGTYSGQEVFARAQLGDEMAKEEVEAFYQYVARGIFSLQFIVDPECILIGGGVSANPDLLAELTVRLKSLFAEHQIHDFFPTIKVCEFKNDANLIGAVARFYHAQKAH